MDAYEPRVLSDAVKTIAGFSTYDDLGSPYKLNISSRGFYSSPVVALPQGVSVFVDGVRMNEPEASEVNFDLLPMDHVSRVEVLSGNGSLLGRNSLGGSVNLITTADGRPLGTVELSGGSYGSARGEAIGLRLDGRRGGLVPRRQLQPGGRLAAAHRRRGVPGLRQSRQARRHERHPLPGLLLQFAGGDGGLAAGVHLRDECRLEPERRRL